MPKLKETHLVYQPNGMGRIVDKKLTPTQQKFIAIYLSKLNSRDKDTRAVRFSLDEYARIMQIKRFNIVQLKQVAEEILSKVVFFDLPRGGFFATQFFGTFKLEQDEQDQQWYVSIDCHDHMLPFMFELKREFFKYELWNILRLSERNHQQMYRLLKEREKIGERIMTIAELKQSLGLDEGKYKDYRNFKRAVIDPCQKALQEHTDIKFICEPIRRGRGGKTLAIKFLIEKNDQYIDQLSLADYVGQQETPVLDGEPAEFFVGQAPAEAEVEASTSPISVPVEMQVNDDPIMSKLNFMNNACNDEFKFLQVQVLFELVAKAVPYSPRCDIDRFDYLRSKYNEMNMRNPAKSRFGYLKKLIENDLEKQKQ